ncbi:class I SAM-dependent methyltransferase [uncultured Rikenella sp.]|uniref:class I SAM-dependent methyltransferase n=1 Tax=uncultured Rikenella sp. TaxID=368003 RepID=UPI0026134C96|nr:class I SAM-dependent methyltransferase [uncultured Rikenella sp.]
MEMTLMSPDGWRDYELIDSGGGRKLERFGAVVVARPEPQALWATSLPEAEWEARAEAIFRKNKGSEDRGEWLLKRGTPQQWFIGYRNPAGLNLKMRLGLTSFKHVGIFPEQAANWDYIYDAVRRLRAGGVIRPAVLNLFAYTGGASLAACAGGAEVTHVDSVRQTVTWSRENMEASGLEGVRWVVEDAMKFVRREVRRGRRYHGIILDPPSYGRGTEGEKWVLEEQIGEMLSLCAELLEERGCFVVLNLYSMGLSALLARTLADSVFPQLARADAVAEQGELYVTDSFGKRLPLGVFFRFRE